MRLLELINTEASGKRQSIVLAGALAGIANTVVMACVTAAAKTPDSPNLGLFVPLLLGLALFVVCYKQSAQQTTILFEDALYKIKLRVTNKLRRVELQELEQIGTSEIYDRITENMTVISASADMVANLLRSVFMIVFGALYMIYLSAPAFILVSLLCAISIAMYLRNGEEIAGHLRRAAQARMVFFDTLTDLLRGFKEVKFSQRRSDELQEDIGQAADRMRSSTLKANLLLDKNELIPAITIFVLLAALAFVLPRHIPTQAANLSTLFALTLFVFAPVTGLVMGYPSLMRANLALENIDALEKKLDQRVHETETADGDPWGGRFETLEANRVGFSYVGEGDERAFYIGPVSLTITAGEVLFIVGGNGSGKSTLLKVLTGIYPPSQGTLEVNGIPVRPSNVQAYREMIAAIYADFHLFTKLYGLDGIEDEAVRRLLKQMQLDDKTSFADQRFTVQSLSTGQRKRLALIVALLEDRPVYAFDEWAADQDPEFRRYFYEELIPELKRRGKTVLVVTHDDRYFHCADRVATMEVGKLRSVVTKETKPPVEAGSEA